MHGQYSAKCPDIVPWPESWEILRPMCNSLLPSNTNEPIQHQAQQTMQFSNEPAFGNLLVSLQCPVAVSVKPYTSK
jgi:hypothetical protein